MRPNLRADQSCGLVNLREIFLSGCSTSSYFPSSTNGAALAAAGAAPAEAVATGAAATAGAGFGTAAQAVIAAGAEVAPRKAIGTGLAIAAGAATAYDNVRLGPSDVAVEAGQQDSYFKESETGLLTLIPLPATTSATSRDSVEKLWLRS